MKPALFRRASWLDELAGGRKNFAEVGADVATCAATVWKGVKGEQQHTNL
jgi:hypothetical protein